MSISHLQNAGQKSQHEAVNESFEIVANFGYLGTALTNQNYIYTEIKSKLTSGNACYHSFEILLSSCLLSKNINIEIEL
jgi:hypothetical protein